MPKSSFFYGYVIVAISFFLIVIAQGMYSTYGVFFTSFQAEFGWSRTAISGASSLFAFIVGLSSVLLGKFTDKFGPQKILVTSGFITGLGYFLMSQISAAWQLYLLFGVMASIGSSSTEVPLLSTTARWFTKRVGMMTGILKAGTGIGVLIMPLLASWLITSYGWRNSYIVISIICVITILPLSQFLVRDPSKKGLEPYGRLEKDTIKSRMAVDGLSLQQGIHTRQFWLVCAIYFIILYCEFTIFIHLVPYAVDYGFSVVLAGSILSVVGGVSIPVRLVVGAISDKIGNRRPLFICLLALMASFCWLQATKGLWGLYLFATVFGFAYGGLWSIVSPLIVELFGTRSHGVTLGMVIFIGQFGGAAGPIVSGRIFDLTGNYQPAFLILVLVSFAGLILSAFLRPTKISYR